MAAIWVYLVLLTVVALAFVLVPAMRYRAGLKADDLARRKETNVQLFRQRLSELEEEYASQEWSEQEFEKLSTELKRNFLRDMEELDALGTGRFSMKGLRYKIVLPALALLCVPVLAFYVYSNYGSVHDLAAPQLMAAIQEAESEAEQFQALENLAVFLQGRLDRHPGDVQTGYMLGTLYLGTLDDYASAIDTFRRIIEHTEEDRDKATILGQLAQAQYMQAGQRLTSDAEETITRALELNPNEQAVMSLLAMQSFMAGDVQDALSYWRRQLSQLEPGSRQATRLQQQINQVQTLLAQMEIESAQEDVAAGPSITVEVALAPELAAEIDSSMRVFVFARSTTMPMPLAAQTFSVNELPLSITLDDSMAMMPGQTLSSAQSVIVGARVSRSGQAIAESGDFQALSEPVEISGEQQTIKLVISDIVP